MLSYLGATSCVMVTQDRSIAPLKSSLVEHILFAQATLNGRPAHIAMDTGSSVINMWSSVAQRLDVKTKIPAEKSHVSTDGNPSALAGSARLSLNGQDGETPFVLLSWNSGKTDYDGVVGWPQLRDNIIVFNPAQHAVTTVNKLPDVSGWIKLKIHPADILTLEWPLPDGHVGEMVVDTGAVEGVQLSPSLWSAFLQQHPGTVTDTSKYRTSQGARELPHAVADKISLGPLDLTHVDVGEASDYEADGVPGYCGTFGMKTFSRMELVVDGHQGYAYLRPRPASTAKDETKDETKQWIFTGNLNLRTEEMYDILAGALVDSGDYDEATKEISRLLELHPRSSIGLVLRGYLKFKRGEPGALDDIKAALAADPVNATVLFYSFKFKFGQNDFTGALAALDVLIEQHPGDANHYFNRAVVNARLGKNEEALADLDHALQLRPDIPNALALRAGLRDAKKDYDGAISDYTQYLALQPDYVPAYIARANSYFTKGDYARATGDYSLALALEPKNADAWYWRGRSYDLLGDTAKAQADYAKAGELDPKYAPKRN